MSASRIDVAREALSRGVPVRMHVFGSSMAPALVDGAQVEIRPLLAPPLPGEVVAWARLDRLVVHRVVRVEADGHVVTRGDARSDADPPCAPSDLLGRVVLPCGKRPRRTLSSRARAWLGRLSG